MSLTLPTSTNSSLIMQTIDKAINKIWSISKSYDDILFLVTDGASYMVKASKMLKEMYPKMISATCLSHALHLVAEKIRANFPSVDFLIANLKKTFFKSSTRIQKCKDILPNVPLPPKPVITRWGLGLMQLFIVLNNTVPY